PADVHAEGVGVLGRHPVREVFEELALLAPDVRLEQIREGGQCGGERVAAGRGDRVAPRLELAMIRNQGVQERETLRLAGQARAQEGEEGILLGTEVDHEMVGEEGEGVGRAALRRARGGHGRDGSGRRRMMQTEGEAERVAVVVRERNQARVAAASGHVVPPQTGMTTILSDEARGCHPSVRLITLPEDATPCTWPTSRTSSGICSSYRRSERPPITWGWPCRARATPTGWRSWRARRGSCSWVSGIPRPSRRWRGLRGVPGPPPD